MIIDMINRYVQEILVLIASTNSEDLSEYSLLAYTMYGCR